MGGRGGGGGRREHAVRHGRVRAAGEHRLHVTHAALLGHIPHRHLSALLGGILLSEGECPSQYYCVTSGGCTFQYYCYQYCRLAPRFLWWCSSGRRRSPGNWSSTACTSPSSRLMTTSRANGIGWSSTRRESPPNVTCCCRTRATGHFESVLLRRSFPSNYWDKFIKRKVRLAGVRLPRRLWAPGSDRGSVCCRAGHQQVRRHVRSRAHRRAAGPGQERAGLRPHGGDGGEGSLPALLVSGSFQRPAAGSGSV